MNKKVDLELLSRVTSCIFNVFILLSPQLLKAILVGGSRQDVSNSGGGMGADDSEMEVVVGTGGGGGAGGGLGTADNLSELGQMVLTCDSICQSVMTTLLK